MTIIVTKLIDIDGSCPSHLIEVNDSLLSLSLQIQWFIQDAVQLPGAVLTVES